MSDLLNRLNESLRFKGYSTGSYGYLQPDLDGIDAGSDSGTVGESNGTSNIDGGEGLPRVPHAFHSNKEKHRKKRQSNVDATGKDFKLVGDLYETFEESIEKIDHTISEVTYAAYKKDERTPRQKVNGTLIDIFQLLNQVDNLLDVNVRLKTEFELHDEMWPKASPKRLNKIEEKIRSIQTTIKKMY